MIIQDGARYHTSNATRSFVSNHATRLRVHQLPAYSPDDNPIEHLWRNVKRERTYNPYFPTFAALMQAVKDGFSYVQQHADEVKQLVGTYLDQARSQTASSKSFSAGLSLAQLKEHEYACFAGPPAKQVGRILLLHYHGW